MALDDSWIYKHYCVGDYLFTDADFVNHLFKEHRTVFDKIFDEIKYLYKQVTAGSKEARELEKVKKVFEEAYRAETKNPTAAGGVKYSINSKFYEQLDNWDGKTVGFSFVVGETSKALQDAGIPQKQIRWDASKISKLLEKHKGMTIETVREIPELLENPVIVIDSKKGSSSKIVLGNLRDVNGKIVTAVLLLTPTSKKGNILDLIKISSAEGRSHIKSLFTYDDGTAVPVRYVDKKRIRSWLNVNRLQLPLHNLDSDSADIISEPTAKSNPQFYLSTDDRKSKQLAIILETNPMWDDYHTGIRSVKDIRTWEEVLELDDEREGQFVWGDFSREDAENALKRNSVIVYSSNPISNGTFVSTSYTQAWEYAGGNKNRKYIPRKFPLKMLLG